MVFARFSLGGKCPKPVVVLPNVAFESFENLLVQSSDVARNDDHEACDVESFGRLWDPPSLRKFKSMLRL